MSNTTVVKLPDDTLKLITSTQIVTSVSNVVKELLENSIDAGGKIIQVRLENYGLDLIEVKDNGMGVSYDNIQRMFLSGYTSKIKQYNDLDKLNTYGFRGEALAAICKVSKISITTKTATDSLAMMYDIDATGIPVSSKPSHLNNGSVITVTGLFSNLPVRKLYMSSKKKLAEEIKKTENVVKALSLIHPELNVSLVHNKCLVWKKNSVKGLKQSFMQVASLKTVSKMDYIHKSFNEVNIELIIPKPNLDNIEDVFTNSPTSHYVYINRRPIICKKLAEPIQEHIFHHYSKINPTFKYAVSLISINIPSQEVDINLEPNKTKVLLKNEITVIQLIDEMLSNYYKNGNFQCSALDKAIESQLINITESEEMPGSDCLHNEHLVKKPRLESDDLEKISKNKADTEFICKNKNWNIEIINEDPVIVSNSIVQEVLEDNISSQETNENQNLCSQINKNNCVLTAAEVSELNAKLSEKNYKFLTTTNSKNCVTRLVERNDLQSRPENTKILPDWPVRENISVPSNEKPDNIHINNYIINGCSEVLDLPSVTTNPKTIAEIAEEIENDVEKWSSEIIEAMRNNKKDEDDKDSENLEDHLSKFDLSIQSISSQMGKKEMKAFTKFARIMRPKITAEYPRLMFPQVADLLAKRWKALSPAEVKNYEKLAEIVDFNRKIYQQGKESTLKKVSADSKILEKSKNSDKNTDLKSLFEQIKKKNKVSRPPRKEKILDTSFDKIKDLFLNFSNCESGEPIEKDYKILGQLQPSGHWLYINGNEIGHIKHKGLNEMILYQKMISSYSVPKETVKTPILINNEILGTTLWRVLTTVDIKLDKQSKYVVTSDIIIKNGFSIQLEKSENMFSQGFITEVAISIPEYGIQDLKDCLLLLLENGEVGGLAKCRPTSLTNYFMNEAIRLSQQSLQPDYKDIDDMLNTYHLCLRHLNPHCLHSKPIFASIHHIQE